MNLKEKVAVPVKILVAQASAQAEVTELPWQVEAVLQTDIRLTAKIESNCDLQQVLTEFLISASENRTLIAALTAWQDEFTPPFINTRLKLTNHQFEIFAEELAATTGVDIRDFQSVLPLEALPWPVRQLQILDMSTADDLSNCGTATERTNVIANLLKHVSENYDIFRALSAWNISVYGSPFKAVNEQLIETESDFLVTQLEEITGKKLF